MRVMAEYLWIDGAKPTPNIRSKTKILDIPTGIRFEDFVPPVWGFDGSSTEQAEGSSSDCVLKPIKWCKDPIRTTEMVGFPHIIVLNEVYLPSGEPHSSNTRAALKELSMKFAAEEFWFGIEQEYTLFKDGRVLGFPENGFPEEQGKYYCGVGADRIYGREIVEDHMKACLDAGLLFAGINAEVMPGQWEYQIGAGNPLLVSDDLIISRWLLHRIAEEYGVVVSLEPKPVKGDWNGAGAHTNFSTKATRESADSFQAILRKMEAKHAEHVAIYGDKIEERLTGLHETCDMSTFKYGVSDRGASIRIPWHVNKDGKGYLEDRRPCANVDPYKLTAKIMDTVASGAEVSNGMPAIPAEPVTPQVGY